MEYFLKNKTVIMRVLGSVMLVVGFAIHFWVTPQEGLSKNQRAATNVARMEARMAPKGTNISNSQKKDDSKFLKELKNTQEKQMQYLTILAMVFGVAFLGYSFIPIASKGRF